MPSYQPKIEGYWWWCAYRGAITILDSWPTRCPICERKVNQKLSAHHDLIEDFEDIPWTEF